MKLISKEEQREEHTRRTLAAVGILTDAFQEIENLQLIVDQKNAQIKNLNNALRVALAKLSDKGHS